MQYKIEAGKVPQNSKFPLLEDKLKSCVDPATATIIDEFKNGSGTLAGYTSNGKKWIAVGSSGQNLKVYDGYIATNAIGNARALLPHKNLGKVYAAIEWNTGYAGVLIRANGTPEYFQITISQASNGLRVDKVGGTAMVAKSIPLPMIIGKIYHLGVEYDANQIKVYVDHELKLTFSDSDLINNLNIGVISSDMTNKIRCFAVR